MCAGLPAVTNKKVGKKRFSDRKEGNNRNSFYKW